MDKRKMRNPAATTRTSEPLQDGISRKAPRPLAVVLIGAVFAFAGVVGGELPTASGGSSGSTILVFSTFLGGSGDDFASGVAVDGEGNTFVVGVTESADFPISGDAFDTHYAGSAEAFAAKFDPAGNLLFASFLGGQSMEKAFAVQSDREGSVFIAGETFSLDFPTTSNAPDPTYGGAGDAFVARLGPDGLPVFVTFLGGIGYDRAMALTLSELGVWVIGFTSSDDFPVTTDAFHTRIGDTDIFVTRLNQATGKIEYSALFGGEGKDFPTGVAVDASGSVYVGGTTDGPSFPVTEGAFDTSLSPDDGGEGFVFKLSPTGTSLVYSTLLGGDSFDDVLGVTADPQGRALVVGRTYSKDFPTTPAALDPAWKEGDYVKGFVARLDPNGEGVEYATFLGGEVDAVCLGPMGTTYVAGSASPTFPATLDAFDTTDGGAGDAFVALVSSEGDSLEYGTFLGGSYWDRAEGLALGSDHRLFVVGFTESEDFPTTEDAFDSSYNGGRYGDAYLTNFRLDVGPTTGNPSWEGSFQSLPVWLFLTTVAIVIACLLIRRRFRRRRAARMGMAEMGIQTAPYER